VKYMILVVALVLGACASPTRPTATDAKPSAQKTADPPPAEPQPPAPPAPAPPAPAPPAPAPAPPTRTILHVVVTSSYWYPNATFTLPERFDVIIENDTVKIATLDPLPFSYYKSDNEFIVKQHDFIFTVQGGTFGFNGLQGVANGTVARDTP